MPLDHGRVLGKCTAGFLCFDVFAIFQKWSRGKLKRTLREYASEYASEYARVRASTREYARMFDGPNFGELKSSPQAGKNIMLPVHKFLCTV